AKVTQPKKLSCAAKRRTRRASAACAALPASYEADESTPLPVAGLLAVVLIGFFIPPFSQENGRPGQSRARRPSGAGPAVGAAHRTVPGHAMAQLPRTGLPEASRISDHEVSIAFTTFGGSGT